jgi:hypothetical protein
LRCKSPLLEYLLFVVYLFFFAWIITRIKFFTGSGLSKTQLVIVFLLKIITGIFYGWIGIYYGGLAQMWDTWGFHANGLLEKDLLLHHPHAYFTNLFQSPYPGGFLKFFEAQDSFWNDLKGHVLIKVLSVFDLMSLGNYYVNVILYSFVTLFGPVAFYRVMADVFPQKKFQVFIATFLIPSFLYWTSGIHKEGLLFTGLGLIFYSFYAGFRDRHFGWKRWLNILLGTLLIISMRNYLLIVMIPAILAWWLSVKYPRYKWVVFPAVYFLFSLFFFTAKYINPNLDFPHAVVNKQQEFLALPNGRATIVLKQLRPDALSFAGNAPQAMAFSAARPFPGDVHHLLSLAASLEINILLLLILLSVFFRNKTRVKNPVIIASYLFAISVLLVIGFTVNNLGAIVRYRSIIIPLIMTPVIAGIEWKKIKELLHIKIKNNINNS